MKIYPRNEFYGIIGYNGMRMYMIQLFFISVTNLTVNLNNLVGTGKMAMVTHQTTLQCENLLLDKIRGSTIVMQLSAIYFTEA